MGKFKIHRGDCFTLLKSLPENSVDSLVTDPPYGWRFMGKAWDAPDIEKSFIRDAGTDETPKLCSDGRYRKRRVRPAQSAGKYDPSLIASQKFGQWTKEWATEALRVLKPGAHILVFCGPRTYHRMASGLEDAGFEIRDQLQWLFGQGFPKSLNLGDGFGTALKPANEPICLARKPTSEKTVAANVLKWGTGGLNIDASRIPSGTEHFRGEIKTRNAGTWSETKGMHTPGRGFVATDNPQGRFPSNLLLDPESAAMVGETSRFFYVAKTSTRERNEGLESRVTKKVNDGRDTPIDNPFQRGETQRLNTHPTVKPIKLMEYLVRLVTPPNGVVLDPFMGSGSTGLAVHNLGFSFIGIEREKEYFEIAKARIRNVLK